MFFKFIPTPFQNTSQLAARMMGHYKSFRRGFNTSPKGVGIYNTAMLKIGKLKLSYCTPRIALSVSDADLKLINKNINVDLLEVRLDCFKSSDKDYVLSKIKAFKDKGIALILTIRDKLEGGGRFIDDEKKIALFSLLIEFVDAIDIELNSRLLPKAIKLAKANNKVSIASVHNFISTPSVKRLDKFLKESKRSGADIFKIAATAHSIDDMIKLMLFTLRSRCDNIISISLGKKGMLSRILFPLCGSLIAYTYIGKPKAPGQVPYVELKNKFKLFRI